MPSHADRFDPAYLSNQSTLHRVKWTWFKRLPTRLTRKDTPGRSLRGCHASPSLFESLEGLTLHQNAFSFHSLQADLVNGRAACEGLANEIKKREQVLHILINNAGKRACTVLLGQSTLG